MSAAKPDDVSDPDLPAKDAPLSLALRELQRILRGPLFWVITLSGVVLAALAGPYFTLTRLSFPERLVFWGTTLVFSGTLMTFLSIYAYRLTEARGWNWIFTALLAGALGIVPVTASIYLAEGLATGFAPGWLGFFAPLSLMLSVAPPLIGVTLMVNLVIQLQEGEAEAPPSAAPTETPLLLRKLPAHLGHEVLTVQAQDHYVEVTTPRGSALVLMRLGDAVADLSALPGMRVHRSWWVNLGAVMRAGQGASGLELELTGGQVVPVGRSFRAEVRDALKARGL